MVRRNAIAPSRTLRSEMKYSVTTVGLPELTLAEQAALLQRLGYDGMELRVRRVSEAQRAQPPSFWGYHRNDITPERFCELAPEIRSVLSGHGIALAGLATNVSCLDLEQVKLLLDGAVAAGAPFIRVSATDLYRGGRPYREIYGETIAGYARVLAITRGSGVKVVLEIHGGTIHPSASLAHRIVSHFDPALVGVIFDPQNMVSDGYETTELAVELLGPYLAHCHVGGHRPEPQPPDATGTVRWTWPGCRLAEGLYDYPRLLKALAAAGYAGYISVEDFRPVPPEERYGDALAYLKSIEQG
jgi:sugar phosphate isomerase/epimerase